MIQVEINKKIITPFEDIDFFDLGSELVFNGRVRNIENNQKILVRFPVSKTLDVVLIHSQ